MSKSQNVTLIAALGADESFCREDGSSKVKLSPKKLKFIKSSTLSVQPSDSSSSSSKQRASVTNDETKDFTPSTERSSNSFRHMSKSTRYCIRCLLKCIICCCERRRVAAGECSHK